MLIKHAGNLIYDPAWIVELMPVMMNASRIHGERTDYTDRDGNVIKNTSGKPNVTLRSKAVWYSIERETITR